MKLYRTKKARERILSTYDQLLGQWGVPVTQMDLPTRYGLTHVNACGDPKAPPLVLFHGVGDDSALMWIYNAAELAKHFRLYAIDTIGGPGKSVPSEGYGKGFSDALWIDAILDGLKLDAVSMAGVSHGAYLTQAYLAARPERVVKAACLAGGIPAGEGGSPMKTMMKIFLPEALFPTQNNIRKLLRKLAGKNSAAFTDHPLILAHFTALARGYDNMAMRFHPVGNLPDAQIRGYRDKVLYLIGEADPFAKLGGKAMLERYGMNARFFPEVGHGINHEIAGEINAILIEYFGADRR
ncbi:MAG TPA: alpha/beta hydrolase [Clostridia bacterium]|nr:alpha/beta hydrolase [Clostridia bacterium]